MIDEINKFEVQNNLFGKLSMKWYITKETSDDLRNNLHESIFDIRLIGTTTNNEQIVSQLVQKFVKEFCEKHKMEMPKYALSHVIFYKA